MGVKDHEDRIVNPRVAFRSGTLLSRRRFLGSIAGLASLVLPVSAGCVSSHRDSPGSLLGFKGIPPSFADEVVVPPGYSAHVLIAWGDPVSTGAAFRPDASNSAADQAEQWGMHNDGLAFFPLGQGRGLLVQNHEYTDDVLLFPDGMSAWDAEKTLKSQNAHGVSVIEIAQENGRWDVRRPSSYARRITANTPMKIAGPLAGDPRMRTRGDPSGQMVLGTLNNCGMGVTPWGTYLSCEENFNHYFRKNGAPTPFERRYGLSAFTTVPWYLTDARFRVDEEPHEPHRFGWIVEIDPFSAHSTPIKRTAMGRFKHEGAKVQEARDGRVVVYSGDDQPGEYLYRFVSKWPWREAFQRKTHPLDEGTLAVARFDEGGRGEWIPLTPAHPALAGRSLQDILLDARSAADAVGATPMDRPEWVDTFPDALRAVVSLTNSSASSATAGANPANPRRPNPYGHLVAWQHERDWTESHFTWEIFALAGDPDRPETGSTLRGDKYGSPDGLYVAPSGRLWVLTDVSSSQAATEAYRGFGNNQMLCVDPHTRQTRRFLVGPRGCEITGAMTTPDEKALFVGIQHPGELPSKRRDATRPDALSSWPDHAPNGRPRSACIVVTRDDGGEIGG